MKNAIVFLVVLTAFTVFACSYSSSEDELEAPDMGTASELADNSGTPPADEAAAKALYVDSLNAFGSTMSAEGTGGKGIAGKGTTTKSMTIDWTASAGGGTVNVTGSMDSALTSPDETFAPVVGQTYNDLYKAVVSAIVNGSFLGITVSSETHSYTISGKATEDLDLNANLDMTVVAKETFEYNLDLSYSLIFGFAFSVLRDDGVGAKFIVSYAGSIEKNDIEDVTDSDALARMMAELQAKKATLRVYDADSDELLQTVQIGLDEIGGSQLEGALGA